MVALWKKAKTELKDEDYNNFYKSKNYDYKDPVRHIPAMNIEGSVTHNALLYIPGQRGDELLYQGLRKGLAAVLQRRLIMDRCADLLPDHFNFVRGLVDTADLSVNISRSFSACRVIFKLIAGALEKKIKNELAGMMKNHRETYEKLVEAFGLSSSTAHTLLRHAQGTASGFAAVPHCGQR